ncbi:MAG: COX15/CtaA family protein [Bacteroidetes bacterium]|nr:COX15/CtaA family protein [Bacteroidota bacterium]
MSPIARKVVGWWLLIGCLMVFFQVIVGGVTRLTESGLSITEWKPVKGIVPPLNDTEWQAEFELYRQKVQYKTINEDMQVSEFKWIYFWEYFHRFWARFMGFVFIIPFVIFVANKWLDKAFFQKIGVLFLWGGLIGIYGWIMVKSGLTGIYVPPIHLSIHLFLALSMFGWLVYMTVSVFRLDYHPSFTHHLPSLKRLSLIILIVLFMQVIFGGIVSGMKAGLAYPTWPDMNGQIIPSALFNEPASTAGFTQYNTQDFWGRTFIQFVHRCTAYLLLILVFVFYFKSRKASTDKVFNVGLNLLPVAVLLQATIGILTVLNCVGKIPVGWGVLHQAGAMLLIANLSFVMFHLFAKPKEVKEHIL